MSSVLLFTVFVSGALSCTSETNVVAADPAVDYTVSDSVNGIRFEAAAKQLNPEALVSVTCTLFNDNDDTAYFVTSSCAGEAYSIQYDTSLFYLNPMINCNASWPMMSKIPPHGNVVLETHFINRKNQPTMKLGYDFFKVKPTFDISKLSLADVHYRPQQNKTVVWADAVTIER